MKNNELKNENIVSKKFMIFTASLLTLLGICYGFVYFNLNFDDNEKEDSQINEKELSKKCNGYLEIVLDWESKALKTYDISENEVTKFYSKFDFDKLKKIDYKDDVYDYSLKLCDINVYFVGEDSIVYYDDNYYELGDNDDYVSNFVDEILDETDFVFFYKIKPDVITFDLKEEDFSLIRDVVNNLDYSEKNIDLFIEGKYLLVVDDKKIYFDNFTGYALYHGEIVKLNTEVLGILESYTKVKSDECCSCCPDLKPGESCIAVCCPCGS